MNDLFFEFTLLREWTIMFGFAYNDTETEKRIEIFLGVFALSFAKLK